MIRKINSMSRVNKKKLENVKIFLLRIELGAGGEEGAAAKSRGRSEGLELGQEHRAEKRMG